MVAQEKNIEIKVWNVPVNDFIDIPTFQQHIDNPANRVSLKKGTEISAEDASAYYLFLLEGMIKVSALEKRKEVTKYLFLKNELLGIAPEITIDQKDQKITCLENTVLVKIPKEIFANFILDQVNWKMEVFNIIQNQSQELTNRITSFVYKDSRSRIIEYLLEMNEKYGTRVGFEYVIRDFLKHQDLANITATSRQTVTTVLNELREKEIIKFDRKRLLIRDLDKLSDEVYAD